MIPVHLIGLGMSPEDLPARTLKIIQAAEVLAGGRRHLEYFAAHPGQKIVVGKDVAGALAAIREAAASRQVVVLASGDPLYYGIGRRLVEFVGPENVVVLPNITAVQSAAGALRMTWDDAVVVSLHGRGMGALTGVLGAEKIFVYTAGPAGPQEIAGLLQRPGMPRYVMCVAENLGTPGQQVSRLRPAEALGRTFAPLNMVVLIKEGGAPPHQVHLGLPEADLEHEAGLITKTEVRAVVLAKLRLWPGLVLWDVGAGCGSVGLEASVLVPGGRVLAVEQKPERARQIHVNQAKYGVTNLEVICGAAPGCLEGLPAPDRVFIGGGGRSLANILQTVLPRLPAQGRVVVAATLMQTLTTSTEFLEARGWETEICQVQVSRSRQLGGSSYLQALNPVWIITGTPREATA